MTQESKYAPLLAELKRAHRGTFPDEQDGTALCIGCSKPCEPECPTVEAIDDFGASHASLLAALERCVRVMNVAVGPIAKEYRGKHNALDEAIEQAVLAIKETQS